MRSLFYIFLLSIYSSSLLAGEKFSPIGCEYSIEFPSTPKKYNIQKAISDGSSIPLYGAELATPKALIRAECASTGQNDLSQFTEKSMITYMEQLALDNGISRSNFEVKTNSLGLVGELTGVKDSDRGRMTVRITNYVGSKSILTTYIASLSKDFQTKEMRSFIKTVQKKSTTNPFNIYLNKG